MTRLDRMSSNRQVAQLAATLGREFDYELLAAVATVDEQTLWAELAKRSSSSGLSDVARDCATPSPASIALAPTRTPSISIHSVSLLPLPTFTPREITFSCKKSS